jgi:hypothetical protein
VAPTTEILPREPEIAPEFSEEALALSFARRHANDLRYTTAWGLNRGQPRLSQAQRRLPLLSVSPRQTAD